MATATVDALTPIRDGVRAYFADPARNVVADVQAGQWNVERNNGPAYVTIGYGTFTYAGAAAISPGVRSAPSHWWDLGGGMVAPVIGQRQQTFLVWVHSPGEGTTPFEDTDPTTIPLDAQVATMALSDLTWAALRDIHGHDLPPAPGKVFSPERGEATYGAAVTWGFVIPVPVLGDPYPYAAAQKMSGSTFVVVNGTDALPGDPIGAP